jgi:hypothetical protein
VQSDRARPFARADERNALGLKQEVEIPDGHGNLQELRRWSVPGGKNLSLRRKLLMPLTLREFDRDQNVSAMHKTVAAPQGRAKHRRHRAAWQNVPATLARGKWDIFKYLRDS